MMPKSLDDFVSEALRSVPEFAPDDVPGLAGWVLLDVREPEEFEAGHIPGSFNVPRGMIEVCADLEHHRSDPRLADRGQKVLCICGGGFRSALAGKTLQDMGFQTVASLQGGWRRWIQEGNPVEL